MTISLNLNPLRSPWPQTHPSCSSLSPPNTPIVQLSALTLHTLRRLFSPNSRAFVIHARTVGHRDPVYMWTPHGTVCFPIIWIHGVNSVLTPSALGFLLLFYQSDFSRCTPMERFASQTDSDSDTSHSWSTAVTLKTIFWNPYDYKGN